ncbi:MAG: hypothetical protein H8E19_06525 [Deltaproteobacteria bacterium]|uniref:Uncharacterized protein n=1 Tax=Candidatus Desulfacyla euxinica TaxID=2841693 RepID=A0A8J6MYL3_9DELT|nr:hypothetical protein [Candidatus Desulfacyla euxinica]MBL7217917.1 hypothetical protein [Desulfobacteraceae bacterium]
MLARHNRHSTQTEALIAQIKNRARNLYLTRQLLCAEAVLVTLNQGLDGGLSDAQAIAMAAPFSIALGGSGWAYETERFRYGPQGLIRSLHFLTDPLRIPLRWCRF